MSYPTNPNYQKSVLAAYTVIDQEVAANAPVEFDNIDVLSGCAIQYVAGTPTIVIEKPGLYMVAIDATVSATAAGTVSMAIYKNGEQIPGAIASETAAAAADVASLNLNTVVRVRPSCCAIDNTARLQVVNGATAGTYTDAHVTVIKIC